MHPYNPTTGIVLQGVAMGWHVVRAVGEDLAGNTASAVFKWNVDFEPPVLAVRVLQGPFVRSSQVLLRPRLPLPQQRHGGCTPRLSPPLRPPPGDLAGGDGGGGDACVVGCGLQRCHYQVT